MKSTDITETLKGFVSLAEFREFLEEQINDGQEISRGKDPLDKSKEQKSEEEPVEEEEGEEVVAGEEGGEEAAPVVDPVAAPGSQVTIGNKTIDKNEDPDAVEVKISGKKNKVKMNPTANINDSSPR